MNNTGTTNCPLTPLEPPFCPQEGFDVYNCLDLMHNKEFLKDLQYGQGDGKLRYYLYNYRMRPVQPKRVGLVLL